MKQLRFFVAIVFAFSVFSCSSVAVKTDYDRDQSFSHYKTYRWAEGKELNPDDFLQSNPLIGKRVRSSINMVLQRKGFKQVESGESDFVVVAHAGVKERMQMTTVGGGFHSGWYDPWWGGYGARTHVSYYEEGTLVIDVVDAVKKDLAWRGLGTGTVKDYNDSAKMEKDIDEAVTKILAGFPPGSGMTTSK